jgi:predicted site-specific integrase-resolvase
VYDPVVTVSRRNAPEPARLLTDREAGERLAVSPRTVREYRYDGRLPTVDLGYRTKRTTAAGVEQLIQRRTVR